MEQRLAVQTIVLWLMGPQTPLLSPGPNQGGSRQAWEKGRRLHRGRVRKVIFIVVNSEKELNGRWYLLEKSPPFKVKLKSYSVISIARYNYDTVMLLRDSFGRWTQEVQQNRCGSGPISTEPEACGDIQFYLVDVKFDALKDERERVYLNELPTSFKLPSVGVDRLRNAARRILVDSEEYQRFLSSLR